MRQMYGRTVLVLKVLNSTRTVMISRFFAEAVKGAMLYADSLVGIDFRANGHMCYKYIRAELHPLKV